MWFGLAWSGVWCLEFGEFGQSDVGDEVQERTAGLGGKPVLDASFTGSSQLSYKLINEAMAAPGGGSVLVSIGMGSQPGQALDRISFPHDLLLLTCPGLTWS